MGPHAIDEQMGKKVDKNTFDLNSDGPRAFDEKMGSFSNVILLSKTDKIMEPLTPLATVQQAVRHMSTVPEPLILRRHHSKHHLWGLPQSSNNGGYVSSACFSLILQAVSSWTIFQIHLTMLLIY